MSLNKTLVLLQNQCSKRCNTWPWMIHQAIWPGN